MNVTASIKEEKQEVRKGSKSKSKAQLYTPRLKMSFCSSHCITPVLNRKILSQKTSKPSNKGKYYRVLTFGNKMKDIFIDI